MPIASRRVNYLGINQEVKDYKVLLKEIKNILKYTKCSMFMNQKT